MNNNIESNRCDTRRKREITFHKFKLVKTIPIFYFNFNKSLQQLQEKLKLVFKCILRYTAKGMLRNSYQIVDPVLNSKYNDT